MLVPENEPEYPRNEKVCSKSFRYCAISYLYGEAIGDYELGHPMLWGRIDIERRLTRDQLVQQLMEVLAIRAALSGMQWNAMNVNVLIKSV